MGLLIIAFAGILNATFVVPSRFLRCVTKETAWFFLASFGFMILPWVFCFFVSPNCLKFYYALHSVSLLLLIIGGVIFGVGQILFYKSINILGIALSFSINLGLGTVIGSSFLFFDHDRLSFLKQIYIIAAIILILISLTLIFFTKRKNKTVTNKITYKKYCIGWFFAVFAGFASGAQNITFLSLIALNQSAALNQSLFWVWPPFLFFSAIPMLIFFKNKLGFLSGNKEANELIIVDVLKMIFMAFCFVGSLLLYSIGMNLLAHSYRIIGWPLFMSTIILISQFWGWCFKEFSGLNRCKIFIAILSIILLLAAIFLLAFF